MIATSNNDAQDARSFRNGKKEETRARKLSDKETPDERLRLLRNDIELLNKAIAELTAAGRRAGLIE